MLTHSDRPDQIDPALLRPGRLDQASAPVAPVGEYPQLTNPS